MPFPTQVTAEPSAQAQVQGTEPLLASKKTGHGLSPTQLGGPTLARQDNPATKPWAHFVAGGYSSPFQSTIRHGIVC